MNFNQRLTQLAGRLSTSSDRWDTAEQNMQSSDRYFRNANRDFGRAERAQQWARMDTARTDSSWHGRDIERGFDDGTRNVQWSEGDIRRADRQVDSLTEELSSADSDLDVLIADMKAAADARVAQVEAASASLNSSEVSCGSLGREFNQYTSSANFLRMDARRADHDIWQIVSDRPGRDVSNHAWRVGNTLRDIEREMRDMDRAMGNAERNGASGDQQLNSAIEALQKAAQS